MDLRLEKVARLSIHLKAFASNLEIFPHMIFAVAVALCASLSHSVVIVARLWSACFSLRCEQGNTGVLSLPPV